MISASVSGVEVNILTCFSSMILAAWSARLLSPCRYRLTRSDTLNLCPEFLQHKDFVHGYIIGHHNTAFIAPTPISLTVILEL